MLPLVNQTCLSYQRKMTDNQSHMSYAGAPLTVRAAAVSVRHYGVGVLGGP